jgi:hypothetical protein
VAVSFIAKSSADLLEVRQGCLETK